MITRRQLFQGLGAATAGGVGLSGYALAEGFGTSVTNYRLTPPRWPQGLSLKLAVLADLHACKPWMDVERIEGIVAQVNALRPDAVLLLGDFVAGRRLARYSEPLPRQGLGRCARRPQGAARCSRRARQSRLVGRARGAGSALGSDQSRHRAPERRHHAHENTALRLVKDGAPGWIAGLGDQWAFYPKRWSNFAGYTGVDDLAGTLALATDDAPIILMAHEPDIFPKVPVRVALTVCGHTHGGQVRVFGFAPYVPSKFGDPLHLRPYRRRRTQPHRLRWSRLFGYRCASARRRRSS